MDVDRNPGPDLGQAQKWLIGYITKEHILGTIYNQQTEEHTIPLP
jgi:hypothetical protein